MGRSGSIGDIAGSSHNTNSNVKWLQVIEDPAILIVSLTLDVQLITAQTFLVLESLILRKTKSSITMKVPTITAAILSSVVPASPGVVAETLKYNRDYDHAQNPELALFSCPDGANGLMTRCRGNNLQQLRNKLQAGTYVGASPAITKWNDLNCGRFLRATISSNTKTFNSVAKEILVL